MPSIGFIILSHDKPAQLLRLCLRLQQMFHGAPIVCHHDFGQTKVNTSQFPRRVRFVHPHLATAWGHFSVVLAFLRALRLLYDTPSPPDWFVLLSGTCYPARPGSELMDELASSGFDAYMDYRRIVYIPTPQPRAPEETSAFRRPYYVQVAYDRYVAATFRFRSVTRRFKPTVRQITLRSPKVNFPFHPFSESFACHGGDHWFMARHTAARRLLANTPIRQKLLKHFSSRVLAEEAFYQTLLCNDPGLRICSDNKRYADWSHVVAHPKVLGTKDVPNIVASRAFFARKFDLSSGEDVFRQLDEITERVSAIH